MKELVKRFVRDEKGLETIEWTLMAAVVALGVIILFGPVRTAIQGVFTDLAAKLDERPV